MQRENESEPISKEARDYQADPTLPVCISQGQLHGLHADKEDLKAKKHGNEPSRGAKIDAELQQEEEELLKKKGIK